MTKQYNNASANGNQSFRITDYVEFDHNGRGLCPCCSPDHKNQSKTLALVPNTDGAYKCFRGCTTEEIREAIGVPKREYIPHNLYKNSSATQNHNSQKSKKEKKRKVYDEQRVINDFTRLMSLRGSSLDGIRWLANRGITTDLVKHYRLGITRVNTKMGKMENAISIPIPTHDGYYIKSRIAPWDKKITSHEKYEPWSQWGIPATVYFTYNPSNARETWLCEGEWDAILLGWLVSKTRDDVAVASFTCGCNSVPDKEELDRLPGQVIIFYDRNDKLTRRGTRASEEGVKKVTKALGERAKIGQVPMPEKCTIKGWDVSDAINEGYSIESFERAVLEAQPIKKLENNTFARRTRTLKKLFDESEDYIEWLLPDLLPPNEAVLLAASPRVGKSLFALSLARAIAGGSKFLDRPCPQGKVLYICKEDSDVKVKIRLNMQGWNEQELNNVIIENDFTMDEFPDLAAYVREIRPSLIIFDTLSRIQKSNCRENSSEMTDVIAPIQDLARTENVCCLIIHHTTKGNLDKVELKDIFDLARGSGAIRQTCRAMMVLVESENSFRLAAENGFSDKLDLAVHLNPADLIWRLNGHWIPPHVDLTQKDLVFAWFKKHREGTIELVHRGTQIPKRNIYQILTRLTSQNTIMRTGSQRTTKYYLPVQQVQQAAKLLNSSNIYIDNDQDRSSTTLRRDTPPNDPIKKDTKLYLRDRFGGGSADSVELAIAEGQKPVVNNNLTLQQSSTNGGVVELNGQNPIKIEKTDQIQFDHNKHTTSFFEEIRSPESNQEESREKNDTLIGVFHQSKGYCRVISQKGRKLELCESGLLAKYHSFPSSLRYCDNRREYENLCTF